MKAFNVNKGIEDADDFSEVASEQLSCFLEELIKDPSMIREIDENDDFVPDGCTFLYTPKAVKIIEDYRSRLHRIGETHFPDNYEDININSYLYIED